MGAQAQGGQSAGASGGSKLQWHARGVPLKQAGAATSATETAVEKPGDKRAASLRPHADQTGAPGLLPAADARTVKKLQRIARSRVHGPVVQASAVDEDPFEEVTAEQVPDTGDTAPSAAGQEPSAEVQEPVPATQASPAAEPAPGEEPSRRRYDEGLQERDFAPLPPRRRGSSDELPPGDLSLGISTPPGDVGCKDYGADCLRAIRELQSRDITQVVVGLVIEGVEGEDYPCDCRLGGNVESPPYQRRNFARTCFTWKASALCHKPLYFEDVQLERYGHSWNPVLQPFLSGAHFFVSVPLLPYKMGLNPPNECIYSLGYYRPGSCAPYMLEPVPLSLRAAIYQGLGSTAFAFWFWPG